jgi:hypothetical protein
MHPVEIANKGNYEKDRLMMIAHLSCLGERGRCETKANNQSTSYSIKLSGNILDYKSEFTKPQISKLHSNIY